VKQSEYKRQLQTSTNKELETMLSEERKNLYGLRQQIAMKQLSNPLAIRESRKRIAQLLTIMHEKAAKEAKEQTKA
jgi:ribosomal protein L29